MRGNTDEGQREILGLEVAFGETQAAWERLLGRLKKRGLEGVKLEGVDLEGVEGATSDAHDGLRQAVEETFPGVIWQRYHLEESLGVHFRRNVLDQTPANQTPAKLKDEMHDRLDDILEASSPAKARAAFGRVEAALEGKADATLAVLSGGWEQATAVLALPAKYRRRLRTSNMIERFIEEIRRRQQVVLHEEASEEHAVPVLVGDLLLEVPRLVAAVASPFVAESTGPGAKAATEFGLFVR